MARPVRCAQRVTLFGLIALVTLSVASCGRIGFDEKLEGDASVLDVRVADGTADPDVGESRDQGLVGDDSSGDEPSSDAASGDVGVPVDPDAATCSPVCANPHGTTSCDSSACVPVCATGYADCDGNLSNGCEANLQADPMHCGSCSRACTVDSGSATCQTGACGASTCAMGTGDCDGNQANGCEANLNTSAANCGFCGNACTYGHATGTCLGGACKLGPCNAGFADCDGNAANGCETDLNSSTNHCGTCAVSCTNANGSTSCASGMCAPSCSGGFADCDSNLANGCETSTATTTNCGTCNHACTADAGMATCTSGTCGTTCDLSGTWAAKVTIPVTWPTSANIASGSGTMGFWLLVNGTQSGNTIPVTMVPCEVTIPDFSSTPAAGSELYEVAFPTSLFDHTPSFLPTTSSTVTLGGSSPGSAYTVPSAAFLLGLSMTTPTTDPWPSTPETVTQVDMDQDGHPGVTSAFKTGGGYSLGSVNGLGTVRADKPYLALRIVVSLSATLSGCTGVSGSATVTHVDTHTIGCDITGGGGACTQTQSDFADTNKPTLVPGSAAVSLVKIVNAGTCADVRAAL
jgi:hypothetical protein